MMMHVLAAAILLALTLSCARAWRVHRAVPPLVLLCAIVCGWNVLSAYRELADSFALRRLDTALSPLTVGATFHFVSAYVGRGHELRLWRGAIYTYLLVVSAAALSGPFVQPVANFAGSRAWAVSVLVAVAVAVPACAKLLWDHWRAFSAGREAVRTWTIGAALVVASALFSTALIDQIFPALPDLSAIGSVYLGAMLWAAVGRADLLEQRADLRFGFVAFGAALVAGLAVAVSLSLLAVSAYWLVLGLPVVLSLLAVFAYPIWQRRSTERRQREELVWSGVLSQQLAHDVQNPLAAVRGAVQFLLEERAQGRSLEDQGEFLELIEAESKRASKVIKRFERLYRMQLDRSEVDLVELSRIAAGAVSLALSREVKTDFEQSSLTVAADADLLRIALDNLIRNAAEASGVECAIELRLRSTDKHVELSVRDQGKGMSPRIVEQVMERGYSRKQGGLGLGLAFASRVLRAHGGRLLLSSAEGRGTVVTLQLGVARGE